MSKIQTQAPPAAAGASKSPRPSETPDPYDFYDFSALLTDEERLVINRHPVDGARILLQSHDDLEVAAAVAYEHHVMLDGGGYPAMHYRRECALASRLVHVCDVYDALRTKRPYRDAWESARAVAYLGERSGTEFDPDLVAAFTQMLAEGEARVAQMET